MVSSHIAYREIDLRKERSVEKWYLRLTFDCNSDIMEYLNKRNSTNDDRAADPNFVTTFCFLRISLVSPRC